MMTFREDFTVHALAAALRRGDLSSRELTQDVLERIEQLEPRLHAFITLTPDLALRMADDGRPALAGLAQKPDSRSDESLPALLGDTDCGKGCAGSGRCALHLRLKNPGKLYPALHGHRGAAAAGCGGGGGGQNQYR